MIIASDVEGTLTASRIGLSMNRYLRAHGRGLSQSLYFVERSPSYLLYKAGLMGGSRFKHGWLAGVLRYFAGYTPDAFDAASEWVVEHALWPNRRAEVTAELQQYADAGHQVVLTSGGFAPIIARFAARIGAAASIGTPVEIVDGRLTGRVGGAFNTDATKEANLRAHLDGAALDVAYGDSIADVPMLLTSREAVAVYPDQGLARAAAEHSWRVIGAR